MLGLYPDNGKENGNYYGILGYIGFRVQILKERSGLGFKGWKFQV